MIARIACFSVAVLAAGCAAAGGEASLKESLVPPGTEYWRDDYHFSAAVRANGFIYVSGVVAGLRDGETGRAGQEAAYERAFKRIEDTLAFGGASWDHVVDMTSYHKDLLAEIDAFRVVKDRYVKAPYPAWTAIDIDRLWPENGITEIKVIAVASKS